ncbi:MAG: hypothetical protein AB1714_20625 [Acidobacteriota bacterium]
MIGQRTSRPRWALTLAIALSVAGTLMAEESALQRCAMELARQILQQAAETERWTLTVTNMSSLGEADVRVVREAFEAELRGRLTTHDGESALPSALRLAISENMMGFVLIAQTQTDEAGRTYVSEWPRTQRESSPAAPLRLALNLHPLFRQSYPILDVVPIGERLLVLDPANVSLYKRKEDRWEIGQLLPLPQSAALIRDPRGRLIIEGSSFRVYLPGQHCAGTVDPSLGMDCIAGDADWPLDIDGAGLAPGRNFFERENLPPFYSGARTSSAGQSFLILAGQEGTAHILDRTLKRVAAFHAWGDDVAGIKTSCGEQVVVTLPRGASDYDTVQAFEIPDLRAVAVTSPIKLPGVVTALWSTTTRDNAVVVVFDVDTGTYEAYMLSVDCGR